MATVPIPGCSSGIGFEPAQRQKPFAGPGFGAYAAATFALEAVSEALRLEMSPYGLKVPLIEPGNYLSHIAATARQSSDSLGLRRRTSCTRPSWRIRRRFRSSTAKRAVIPLRLSGSLPMSPPTPPRRFRFPVGTVGFRTVDEWIRDHVTRP
jgi:NAD(P)-dependent dehydrogenase (short-subunit alcohol dehydrogenase family)